jgi:hypothetical protein
MNSKNSCIFFWGRCFTIALRKSWSFFSHVRGIAAILAGVAVIFGGYRLFMGMQPQISLLITIGPLFGFICVFLFHLMKAPKDLYAEATAQAEQMKMSLTTEIADLRSNHADELGKLREGHQPLELEASCKKLSNNDALTCVLSVRNSSETTSADEVTTQLLDIVPAPTVAPRQSAMEYLAVKEEYKIPVEQVIHPKAAVDFEIFTITEDNLGFFVRFRVILRGAKYNKYYQAEKVDDWTEEQGFPPVLKNYNFKVAVSARGRPQVIQEFMMKFNNQEKDLAVIVSRV